MWVKQTLKMVRLLAMILLLVCPTCLLLHVSFVSLHVCLMFSLLVIHYHVCVQMFQLMLLLSPHTNRHSEDISFTVSVFVCPQHFCNRYLRHGLMQGNEILQGGRPAWVAASAGHLPFWWILALGVSPARPMSEKFCQFMLTWADTWHVFSLGRSAWSGDRQYMPVWITIQCCAEVVFKMMSSDATDQRSNTCSHMQSPGLYE